MWYPAKGYPAKEKPAQPSPNFCWKRVRRAPVKESPAVWESPNWMTRTSWDLGSASSWCSWSKKGLRARGFSMPTRGLANECMMRSVTTSRLPSGTGGAVRRATGVVVWVVAVWLVVAEAMEVDGVGEDF